MLPHPLEIHINVLIHSVLERASLQMNIQKRVSFNLKSGPLKTLITVLVSLIYMFEWFWKTRCLIQIQWIYDDHKKNQQESVKLTKHILAVFSCHSTNTEMEIITINYIW